RLPGWVAGPKPQRLPGAPTRQRQLTNQRRAQVVVLFDRRVELAGALHRCRLARLGGGGPWPRREQPAYRVTKRVPHRRDEALQVRVALGTEAQPLLLARRNVQRAEEPVPKRQAGPEVLVEVNRVVGVVDLVMR